MLLNCTSCQNSSHRDVVVCIYILLAFGFGETNHYLVDLAILRSDCGCRVATLVLLYQFNGNSSQRFAGVRVSSCTYVAVDDICGCSCHFSASCPRSNKKEKRKGIEQRTGLNLITRINGDQPLTYQLHCCYHCLLKNTIAVGPLPCARLICINGTAAVVQEPERRRVVCPGTNSKVVTKNIRSYKMSGLSNG